MTDRDENYRGVFDGAVGFGKAPAILAIDFLQAYSTPGAPLYAPAVVEAAMRSVALFEAARRVCVPIIHTRVLYHPTYLDGGLFVKKVPALRAMVRGEPLAEFIPQVAPAADELVLVKNYASAFFGTSLAATLTSMGIDTIVLTGCSTSGCIRATAIDGLQHGYRVVVPRECVGDRHHAPHEANLFDINAKYGDVLGLDEVLSLLSGVRS